MRFGYNFGFAKRLGGLVPSAQVSGLTANPTYGNTAQHNVELTASFEGASTWQWQERDNPADATPANISGATSATFTPVIGTNITDTYQIRAVPDGNAENASTWYTVRYAPLTVNTAATASGTPTNGGNFTGTAATFSGTGGGGVTSEWEYSSNEVTWTGSGDTDTTSPTTDTAGLYWRFTSQETNSGGTTTSSSDSLGPIPAISYLLLEDGSYFLLEDGSRLILE